MTREELLKVAKPILFNTDMVRAILDDRKVCTRRVVKGDIPEDAVWGYTTFTPKGYISFRAMYAEGYGEKFVKLPCKKGDILYVRETWRVGAWDIRNQMIAFDYKDGTCGNFRYISDRQLFERLVNQSGEDARKAGCEYDGADFVWEKGKSPCRWHPSIHMPKEAARIFLKVTDVRVERLQDIDDKGAYAEGAGEKDVIYQIGGRVCEFAKIWQSTVDKKQLEQYGWDANPWVWVIKFERMGKNESIEGDS